MSLPASAPLFDASALATTLEAVLEELRPNLQRAQREVRRLQQGANRAPSVDNGMTQPDAEALEQALAQFHLEAQVLTAQVDRSLAAAQALDGVVRTATGKTWLPEVAAMEDTDRTRALAAQVEHLQAEVRTLRATLDRAGALAGAAPTTLTPNAQAHLAGYEAFVRVAQDETGRRKPLGQILVDAGVISDQQRHRALQEQASAWNRHLGAILVELGYASEQHIAEAIAAQVHMPFQRIDVDTVQREATRQISGQLAVYHTCIPLAISDDTLTVAIANPLDLVALDDLARLTDKTVQVVVATASDIKLAIRTCYPHVAAG